MPTIEEARAWYTHADPVHDFDHVLRVYHTAGRLAEIEGADIEIVRAAVLLHDAAGGLEATGNGVPDTETRASHHHLSADYAGTILRQEGWTEERIAAVQHCIRGHRFRSDGEAPETLEAKVLFDADKLDVLGAIGAVRVVVYAAIHQQPIYREPSALFFRTGEKEPGEPHSAYHEYLFKLRKIKDRLFTETARAIAIERDQYLKLFFERLAAERDGEL